MKKYLKIWLQLVNLATSSYLTNRIDSLCYFIGKIVRFLLFLLLIFSIFRYTNSLAGYGKYQVVLFFLTFNFIDVFSQALFRGIYLFGHDIRFGNFDFALAKPVNSLFYSLSRLTDILDIIFLAPIAAMIIFVLNKLDLLTWAHILGYLLSIFFSLIIITAIHIISAAVTMWKTESENNIWLYREALAAGRFPPEIFSRKLQFLFTYIFPVIIIIAFPAKVILGQLTAAQIIISVIYALGFFTFSLLIWKLGLKHYSSASS